MAKDYDVKVLSDITLAAGDRILSEGEENYQYLVVTTGHATNAIIAPCIVDQNFLIMNQDVTNNVIIKVAGRVGVIVLPSTDIWVTCNGTDYVEVTGVAVEVTEGGVQIITGAKTFNDNKLLTNTILEKTAGSGVTIDGLKLKDGSILNPDPTNMLNNSALIDSNSDNLPNLWTLLGTPTLVVADDTLCAYNDGHKQVTITGTGAANEGIQILGGVANWLKVRPATIYTFSVYYKVTSGDHLTVHIHSYNGATIGTAHVTVATLAATAATRYEVTFTTDADATNLHIELKAAADTDVVVVSHPKLEIGSIATAYNVKPVFDYGDETLSGIKTFDTVTTTTANITDAYITNTTTVLNRAARCQYTYVGGMIISIGGGGVIPFPTIVEDTGVMRPWTVLSTGACDTDTASHLKDADGTDWTTIDALTAPLLFPIRSIVANTYAVANTVAAHDITLSADIFPVGNETYAIYDPTFHIAVNGLYLVDVKIAIAAVEATKHYKLDIISPIVTPIILDKTEFDAAAGTGATTISYTGLLTLAAGARLYAKLSSNCAGTVTVGVSTITITKL